MQTVISVAMQSIIKNSNNKLPTILNGFFFVEKLSIAGNKTYKRKTEPIPNLKLDFKAILP